MCRTTQQCIFLRDLTLIFPVIVTTWFIYCCTIYRPMRSKQLKWFLRFSCWMHAQSAQQSPNALSLIHYKKVDDYFIHSIRRTILNASLTALYNTLHWSISVWAALFFGSSFRMVVKSPRASRYFFSICTKKREVDESCVEDDKL